MPQTIGSRYEAKLRAQERLTPFSEADDFRLLNEAIERNTKSDPNIAINRQLTREDKEWTSKALDIDTQAAQFAEFILEGDTKDKTIRDDLNIKEINHAKKALPGLMESLHAMNPEGDPRTTNYINAMNMKFSTALQTAEKSAFLKDSLGNVQELIEDLGDDERLEGKWNLKDTQFFIDNVKTLSKSYLDASGEDVDDHFQPLIQMHDDKRAVFSALAHFTKPGSQANANVKASPRADANLNAAIRLMQDSQNENIEEVKELLDKIPEYIGQTADTNLTQYQKDLGDKEKTRLDEIESVGQALTSAADSYFKADMDKAIQDKMGFTITNYKANTFKTKAGRDVISKDTHIKLKSLLKGVKNFNEDTKFENEDYASDLEIKSELKKKNPNMNIIVRYFTDERPVETNAGTKTLGHQRIQRIDTGNEDENLPFRGMLEHLIDLEHHIRKQDPADGALVFDEAQKLIKKKENAKKKLQSMLDMRKKQNGRQKG